MSLSIVLPFGKSRGIKDLVFSILTKEAPLKIIQLTNLIRKRYGRQVTFQAVRKALLELVEERVITKQDSGFVINKEWVKDSKKIIDDLYSEIYEEKHKPQKIDSIGEEVSVFTFNSMNNLMAFWENLIRDWYDKFQKGDPNINAWQGSHVWEALLHPETEKKVMGQLKEKGIKSYELITSNTLLDKNVAKFYEKVGVKVSIQPSLSHFDKEFYIATYGPLVVQTQYPPELVRMMDDFFKNTKKIEDLDLTKLSDIVNTKANVKLTIAKNLAMAKQINNSIISQMR